MRPAAALQSSSKSSYSRSGLDRYLSMKLRLVFAFGLALTLALSNSAPITSDVGYKYGQCEAIAKSTGKRCKIGVSNPGDKYCHLHKR